MSATLQELYRFLNEAGVCIEKVRVTTPDRVSITYKNSRSVPPWMKILKRKAGGLFRLKLTNGSGETVYALNLPLAGIKSVRTDSNSPCSFLEMNGGETIQIEYRWI